MADAELIDDWKCEVIAGGYRRASWSGVVVVVADDGRLLAERANVPASVVGWLMLPMLEAAAQKGAEVTIAMVRAGLEKHGTYTDRKAGA